MGIPKFFRFMSERYPLISQLIQENRIPEFDALYLDMNGIIHNCSHPNDNDASFRITEEQIFLAVFNYIAHLFQTIKPKKFFFLAVDGVAPRAKMNQQRSRRFRTAQEAKEAVEKALRKGEELPEGEGFDSNCITPGTPFMARLSEQLKYFIAKKVTEDSDWRGVEIVLSGHEVPGEGEHKIMEYIRLAKAQPGYDPNMRHCLYGLDADLIMLGLLSHDPHFCLLREEVSFGPRKGKAKGLESQNFFLMHLSLFREYLDLEFAELKASTPPLPFEYDLERIIDDFILLNIFVGNDFLPHLPGLHINEGALGRLFDIYKRILPKAGGYLNEHGKLNVKRLQLVLNELTVVETEHFEHEFADTNWYKGKQNGAKVESMEKARARNKLVLTKLQRKTFDQVKTFVLTHIDKLSPNHRLVLANMPAERDRRFLAELADQLRLTAAYDEFDAVGKSVTVLSFDPELIELAAAEWDTEDDEAEAVTLDIKGMPEWQSAITRVLAKYDKASVADDFDESEFEDSHAQQLAVKMDEWKRQYYKEKLEFDYSDSKKVNDLAYRYIEGLQWVLKYYYAGVASWSWFYDYHYAPKISDLANAHTYEFEFDFGHPFLPYEQLMGVLPSLSAAHIPIAFRDLLSDPTSPIIDFYPTEFGFDLNGKKQDWEAIVKIPFIDEKRLLATMATRASKLTPEEKKRNTHGQSWRFTHNGGEPYLLPSTLPDFFADLVHCVCKIEPFKLPTLDGGLEFLPGLVPGVKLGKDAAAGFPSLHSLPFSAALGFHGVNVFMSDSRKETMVVSLLGAGPLEGLASEDVARQVIGQRIFTGYPYLFEGMVSAISDELFRYELDGNGRVRSSAHSPAGVNAWKRSADKLEYVYSKNKGCIIHHVAVVIHAKLLRGLTLQEDGSTVKEFEETEQDFALQSTTATVTNEDLRYVEQEARPVTEDFPVGDKVFFLGEVAYGTPAVVYGHAENSLGIQIAFFPTDRAENHAFQAKLASAHLEQYKPAHALSRPLRMSGLTLSRITSALMITHENQKTNIGLNLKFEAKGQKVLGYSRKGFNGQWEFSEKAVKLIEEFKAAFPEIIETFNNRQGDFQAATDFFGSNATARLKELKAWLVQKGIRDLEKVPLYSEQLDKDAVKMLERYADQLNQTKTAEAIKKAAINNIPRHAVLKSAHATSRLRDQQFALGDRVIMIADSGNVNTSAKGTVVGIQSNFIDVVWDIAFMHGTTLSDRCSPYRGATVTPSSVLNLTQQQFISSIGPKKPQPNGASARKVNPNAKFAQGPRGGPSIVPAHGLPAGGFHPAPNSGKSKANRNVKVLTNPARNVSANTSFTAVATGKAPPRTAPAPQAALTHQQKIQQTLGAKDVPAGQAELNKLFFGAGSQPQQQAGHGHHPGQGFHPVPHRGGFRGVPAHQHQHRGGPPHPMNGHQPVFTAAQRGNPGFRGGIAIGGGIGVPPPAGLNAPSKGRGGARGARGRGGAPRGGGAPQLVKAVPAKAERASDVVV